MRVDVSVGAMAIPAGVVRLLLRAVLIGCAAVAAYLVLSAVSRPAWAQAPAPAGLSAGLTGITSGPGDTVRDAVKAGTGTAAGVPDGRDPAADRAGAAWS